MAENQKPKQKQDLLSRNITVMKDGNINVVDEVKNEYNMTPTEFDSWKNQMKKNKEQLEYALTDDYKKEIEDELKKVKKDLNQLQPKQKEAEKKAETYWEEEKKRTIINRLKEEAKKDKPDQKVIEGFKESINKYKPDLKKELTKKEQGKLNL